MRLIYLKNSTFLSLKITVDRNVNSQEHVRNETSKHYVLKSVKINKLTLLSVGNVPVRFRAQQQTKYSSLSLMANCIAAKRCLRHYFKMIRESPTTKDTNFPPSFKTRIKSPPGCPQPQVSRAYLFNSCNIQGNFQAFRLTELLWWQKLTWLVQYFLKDL